MKKNIIEVPIKAEMEFIDRKGIPHKKPYVLKVNTFTNKGRDKNWYIARKKKNLLETKPLTMN